MSWSKKGPTPGFPRRPSYPLEQPQLALLGADRALDRTPGRVDSWMCTQPAQRIVRHGVGVDRGVALEAQHTASTSTIVAVQHLVQVAAWIEFVAPDIGVLISSTDAMSCSWPRRSICCGKLFNFGSLTIRFWFVLEGIAIHAQEFVLAKCKRIASFRE